MNKPTRKHIRTTLTTLLATTALGLTALATNQPYGVTSTPAATAEFNFRVTLIPVPGKVNAVTAALNVDPKNLNKTSGKVSVNLTKLDTGIGIRDEHARGYIGAEKHPNAVFTLVKITGLNSLEIGKEVTATAVGQFDLNGISTPLSAPITLKLEGNRIKVSTSFDVTLADHKIEIPGADPKVDVKVNFSLEPNRKP
jgi:polyisoprenoid-binding protein YceI